MSELPLNDAIPRFKTNEDRFNTFANGGTTETWQTSGGEEVPSIRKFVADKDSEINAEADGIFAASRDARDTAVAASNSSEASADRAAASAEFARNNWIVSGPFTGTGVVDDLYPLTIDPGSPNNMFVIVGGVAQLASTADYALIYVSGAAKIKMTVPLGVLFEVRSSNAIAVGTPADASVTATKLPAKVISYAKIQDISATARLLGRKSVGAGTVEELSGPDIRDNITPAGAVVDSVWSNNASQAGMTAVIPLDNTVPQAGEGTSIISVTITPKSTTNRLRVRFTGIGSLNALGYIVWAIFRNGVANALNCGATVVPVNGYVVPVAGEWEFIPGATTPITISVNVGPSNGTLVMNGNGNLFGGISASTLIVEEIKA